MEQETQRRRRLLLEERFEIEERLELVKKNRNEEILDVSKERERERQEERAEKLSRPESEKERGENEMLLEIQRTVEMLRGEIQVRFFFYYL